MSERILVTGGAGFIGSHTVDLLLQKNKQVLVLDNLSSGRIDNLDLAHPNLEFIEGDILEYPLIEDLLRGCDAVLHLAAIASVTESIENPIYSLQVNTQGLLHVLCAIAQSKRQIRLVYASSAATYGETKELPCREDTAFKGMPLSPYALEKIHDEDYASLFARLYQTSSLGLRYFNVYGARQNPNSTYSGVITRFFEDYKNTAELTIFGDGRQSRDFIHVSDVARANCLALESHYAGILNIATGMPETLLNIIEYIKIAGKKPIKLRYEAARLGDITASYGATEKAWQQLGFRYSVPLQAGIKDLMADLVLS